MLIPIYLFTLICKMKCVNQACLLAKANPILERQEIGAAQKNFMSGTIPQIARRGVHTQLLFGVIVLNMACQVTTFIWVINHRGRGLMMILHINMPQWKLVNS